MNWSVLVANIISGGFLKGKRTALVAIGTIVGLFIQYASGDIGIAEFLRQSWELGALAVGLVFAAASGNQPANTGK